MPQVSLVLRQNPQAPVGNQALPAGTHPQARERVPHQDHRGVARPARLGSAPATRPQQDAEPGSAPQLEAQVHLERAAPAVLAGRPFSAAPLRRRRRPCLNQPVAERIAEPHPSYAAVSSAAALPPRQVPLQRRPSCDQKAYSARA